MLLMQKYAKDGGAIGVDDLRRWPSDSDAVGFLSETTTAASAQKLMEVCDDLFIKIITSDSSSIH
jgi:hypothetical protein